MQDRKHGVVLRIAVAPCTERLSLKFIEYTLLSELLGRYRQFALVPSRSLARLPAPPAHASLSHVVVYKQVPIRKGCVNGDRNALHINGVDCKE